jgi:hypothetical protein
VVPIATSPKRKVSQMSAVLLAQEFLASVGATNLAADAVTLATSKKRETPTGESIAVTIRNFVGPIVMLAVGLAALVFLFKREMTKFFQFAALAVGVAVFFFAPNFLETLGGWVGSIFGGDGISISSVAKK